MWTTHNITIAGITGTGAFGSPQAILSHTVCLLVNS